MKVILKREVDNLGLPGDVVDVADGYGRNFLLPRGMAILATAGAMKEAEALTRARKAQEAKTLGSAQAAKDVLEARTLRIAARVDDRGNLYGSVNSADVQRVLKERGHEFERKRIELKGTIKQIGSYEIPVRVHPQVTALVPLDIVDEEGKVIARDGGIVVEGEEDIPPLVPAGADAGDSIVDEAIAAAEELEAGETVDAETLDEAADEAAVAAETAPDTEAADAADDEEPAQA
jgi:large subunit ribosomal protein L9